MVRRGLTVRCCIAGGGPAGMMLGLLLARAGVDVVVLEKHADFLRDFRGDTIHPSTLALMSELGFLDEFLKLPHQELHHIDAQIGDTVTPFADFTHLPTPCRFIALMPQWDFLNFIAGKAAAYPFFQLLMRAEATELIEEAGQVVGLRAETEEGALDVRADLVIGADGRHSTIRDKAGFAVHELGAPMDVLWFRLSRRPDDPGAPLGRFDRGRIFIMINRGEHWQCAYVIAKGSIAEVRARGIDAFRADVAKVAPNAADRVAEIRDWDDVKLLTVAVDRLPRWYRPGLLCIGDAAHAMSPIGGVGINLAIQDAVAAANLLAQPLASGTLTVDHLAQVQHRREWPTRVTQRLQITVQNRIISRVLAETSDYQVPFALKLLQKFPLLRRIPARVVGLGVRPEHIQTPR
jgi:2-polyprenyl-6-methoxyphenol hydroxylase-like FAD-dependent oxidoreductase